MLGTLHQATVFAIEKSDMDDSFIELGVESMSQEVLIPSKILKPQTLQIYLKRLPLSREKLLQYEKTHPGVYPTYVMYAVLEQGADAPKPLRVIWANYLSSLPYPLIENGLYSLYRATWDPYRNCVDVVFAQERWRGGLTVELYEVQLSNDLGISPADLQELEPNTFAVAPKPIATLKSDFKGSDSLLFGGIHSLQLLPENKSLLFAFGGGLVTSPHSYFRYTFDTKKWTALDYKETEPIPPPAIRADITEWGSK